jgi:hypothetical protein
MTVDESRTVERVLREIASSGNAAGAGPAANTSDLPSGREASDAATSSGRLDLPLLEMLTEQPFQEDTVLRRLIADALRD